MVGNATLKKHRATRRMFRRRGIAVVDRADVLDHSAVRTSMQVPTSTPLRFPYVFFNGEYVGGYTAARQHIDQFRNAIRAEVSAALVSTDVRGRLTDSVHQLLASATGLTASQGGAHSYWVELDGGDPRVSVRFDTTLLVGRSPGIFDIAFPEDTQLSTAHCAMVLLSDGALAVVDLGSTNGTHVHTRELSKATLNRDPRIVYLGMPSSSSIKVKCSAQITLNIATPTESIRPQPSFSPDHPAIPTSGYFVISRTGCGYCSKLFTLLGDHQITATVAVFNQDQNDTSVRAVYPTVPKSHRTFPYVIINHEFVGGFTDIRELLENQPMQLPIATKNNVLV